MKEYYIQSIKHKGFVGNSVLWWEDCGCGKGHQDRLRAINQAKLAKARDIREEIMAFFKRNGIEVEQRAERFEFRWAEITNSKYLATQLTKIIKKHL